MGWDSFFSYVFPFCHSITTKAFILSKLITNISHLFPQLCVFFFFSLSLMGRVRDVRLLKGFSGLYLNYACAHTDTQNTDTPRAVFKVGQLSPKGTLNLAM